MDVQWYKAHLVAKGFAQEYSIYYEENFVMAVVCHWPIYHKDVKNVFLNGDL